MSVSVIIPCFNGAPFLRESIESALQQSQPPEQVIVVDDGSTDDSVEIARAISGVTVIQQENGGASAARNRAMGVASGEFVVFHDADDRLLPDALAIGARELTTRRECGFVHGFSRQIFADRPPIEPLPRQLHDASYQRTLEGDTFVPPGCAMFRRAAVEAVGGFRGWLWPTDDYDLYLRVSREAPIHCHNQTVVEYRMHQTNATSSSPARMLRAVLRVLDDQRSFVRGRPTLERALESGRRHWGHVFGPGIAFEAVEQLRRGQLGASLKSFALLAAWHPRGVLDVARHYAGRATGGVAAARR